MRMVVQYMWVTEVISGTGLFAVTEKNREKATEVRTALAAQLGDSPAMAERVVPKMVSAVIHTYCHSTSHKLWSFCLINILYMSYCKTEKVTWVYLLTDLCTKGERLLGTCNGEEPLHRQLLLAEDGG